MFDTSLIFTKHYPTLFNDFEVEVIYLKLPVKISFKCFINTYNFTMT